MSRNMRWLTIAGVVVIALVVVSCAAPVAPAPNAASIGDLVWYDTDRDGIRDAPEGGMADVPVELYGSDDTPAGSATTDEDGSYLFRGVAPGDYYVKFTLPTGYVFTQQDQGDDDSVDSDADTTTGKTILITLAAGETDLTWDAGMIEAEPGPTPTPTLPMVAGDTPTPEPSRGATVLGHLQLLEELGWLYPGTVSLMRRMDPVDLLQLLPHLCWFVGGDEALILLRDEFELVDTAEILEDGTVLFDGVPVGKWSLWGGFVPSRDGTRVAGVVYKDFEIREGDSSLDVTLELHVCEPECQRDGDCLVGELCDPPECRPWACEIHEECPDYLQCVEGLCSPAVCRVGEDCLPPAECRDNVCMPPRCRVGADCDQGLECVPGGYCAEAEPECTVNQDCGPDEWCDEGVCVKDVDTTVNGSIPPLREGDVLLPSVYVVPGTLADLQHWYLLDPSVLLNTLPQESVATGSVQDHRISVSDVPPGHYFVVAAWHGPEGGPVYYILVAEFDATGGVVNVQLEWVQGST